MCSTFRPRSSSRTRRPFSVSSLAAHPPEIPEPTTIASNSPDCTDPPLIETTPLPREYHTIPARWRVDDNPRPETHPGLRARGQLRQQLLIGCCGLNG